MRQVEQACIRQGQRHQGPQRKHTFRTSCPFYSVTTTKQISWKAKNSSQQEVEPHCIVCVGGGEGLRKQRGERITLKKCKEPQQQAHKSFIIPLHLLRN